MFESLTRFVFGLAVGFAAVVGLVLLVLVAAGSH